MCPVAYLLGKVLAQGQIDGTVLCLQLAHGWAEGARLGRSAAEGFWYCPRRGREVRYRFQRAPVSRVSPAFSPAPSSGLATQVRDKV
jgi:hypothetical protein